MAEDVSLWCVILEDNPEKGAIRVTDDDEREIWLPRGQITEMPGPYEDGATVLIRITEWIATKKGLV